MVGGAGHARIESSPGVVRTFCGRCGTPMTYSQMDSDSIDITIGVFDDPEALVPTHHIWVDDKLPWVEIADGLPRYRTWKSAGEPLE